MDDAADTAILDTPFTSKYLIEDRSYLNIYVIAQERLEYQATT